MERHPATDAITSPVPADHDQAQDDERNSAHELLPSFMVLDETRSGSKLESSSVAQCRAVTLSEFVRDRFIPDCVTDRKLAGRMHFQFILRLVLTPKQFAEAFAIESHNPKPVPRSDENWPYMGSLQLQFIDRHTVQLLTAAALNAGYSTQTVIHIRNVIRSIFCHAEQTGYFVGNNPASLVVVPIVERKAARALTISQFQQILMVMRYPEKQIAICSVLTNMNFSEICGLTWRTVNLSSYPCLLDSEMLAPKTIAVRYQHYRGEFRPVIGYRKRFIPIADSLPSLFLDLKSHSRFNGPHDFVFASRNGTPINPDNLGTRRLKEIGRILDMPWLSWSVFHHTHVTLKSQFGLAMRQEVERSLCLDAIVGQSRKVQSHQPRNIEVCSSAVEQ